MACPLAMARAQTGLDTLEAFGHGLDHPEGLAIVDATIYVGGEAGQVYIVEEGCAPREVASTGGFALGIAADGAGQLYVCDEYRHCVFQVNSATGEVGVFATGMQDRPMRTPNWPAFDADGNLYISDSGEWKAANGLIWVARPGRRLEIFSEQSVDFPNGIAIATDGSRLYGVESTPGRIIEIPIDDDGSAGPRRVLCELGLVVPDGIAVADDGSLLIACYRPDAIFRWSEADGLDVLASDPQGTILSAPTNVAFMGKDLDILVVPNLAAFPGHLVRGRFGISGTPLPRPPAQLLQSY